MCSMKMKAKEFPRFQNNFFCYGGIQELVKLERKSTIKVGNLLIFNNLICIVVEVDFL
jgi:hypothetical protein